jgi:uncharacterized membrane protein
MNAELEIALESYLTTALQSSFPGVLFRAATKRADLPPDKQLVIAVAREVQRMPVQGQLHKGMVAMMITTPVIDGLTVAMHAAVVKAVQWWMQPRVDATHESSDVAAAQAALDAAVVAALDGRHCRSTRVEGPREQHTQEEWVTSLETLLLITED